jgi:hypothetical protein
LRGDADVPVPSFQLGDIGGARDAAAATLGNDAFLAAFDHGRRRPLDRGVLLSP